MAMPRSSLTKGLRLFCLGLWLALPAAAQTTPDPVKPRLEAAAVLTLDQNRLYTGSRYGQAAESRAAAERAALESENRRIETALEAEEKDLTARRATLTPEAFAPLAAAFDEKVEGIRQAQDAKSREIQGRGDQDRQRFVQTVVPILGEIMTELGAVAIIDKEALVLSLNLIDITDEAIIRIDAVLGDGTPPAP